MYFNHAFRKSFLIGDNGITAGDVVLASSGTTADLTAGQMGLFDAKTFAAISTVPGTNTPFLLAQGSYFTSDKIGPVHGGYKESVKSKVINPKYISRVFVTCSTEPQNQVKAITVGSIECGKTYRLRIDLKGSPALRFLDHNIYRTLDAFSGCCTDDCSATCTGALVDPNVVLLKWADQVNESPFLPNFVKASVWKATYSEVAIDPTSGSATIKVTNANKTKFVAENVVVAAGLPGNTRVVSVGANDSGGSGYANVVLTKKATSSSNVDATVYANIITSTYTPETDVLVIPTIDSFLMFEIAYIETKFGNCTFTPTDFYELQPLLLFASMTDETGDACNVQDFTQTEIVEPRQAQGLGESVLRDMILSGRYRQEAFPDSSRVESLRMREIEGNPGLTSIDRNGFYNTVNILHNVPRLNNPTGTFDNDQYLLTVYIESGVNGFALVDLLSDIVSAAGNGVEVEYLTLSGTACEDFQD